MRIANSESSERLREITLFLTRSELRQLSASLEDLMTGRADQHVHVNDENYKQEITVVLYSPERLDDLDERARVLILEPD